MPRRQEGKTAVSLSFFLLFVVVFSVPGSKLFFVLFLLYSVAVMQECSKVYLSYFLFAMSLASLYSLLSIIRGGDWGIVRSSVYSCIFLLSFFIFAFLFKARSGDEIIKGLNIVAYVFVVYLIFLMLLSVFYPDSLRAIDLLDSNLSVAWYDFMPRVMIKTMVLIGPLSFIAIYSATRFYVVSALFLLVAIVSQEVMAVFLVLLSIFINLVIRKRFAFLLASFFALLFILYAVVDVVYEAKLSSIQEKLSQFTSFIDVLSINPLLGLGLGNSLGGVGLNQEDIYYIEIVPLDFLIKAGMFGFLSFTLLYFYPVWFGFQRYRFSSDPVFLVFSVCHALIVISGLSNAYLLSGTLGFLFPSMLFAYSFLNKKIN